MPCNPEIFLHHDVASSWIFSCYCANCNSADWLSRSFHLRHLLTFCPRQFKCLIFLLALSLGDASLLRRRRATEQNITIETRIVGGSVAGSTRYPYYAFLGFVIAGTNGDECNQCGGTLIHEDIILSAAHCYPGRTSTDQASSYVYVGYSNENAVTGYYEAGMATIVPHPQFDSLTYRNDIMIIKLDKKITQVQPVTLNTNAKIPVAGVEETLIGFGLTSAQGQIGSSVLREAKVNAVNYTTCQKDYAPITIFNDAMICSYRDGKDTCDGDSGGPNLITGNSPSKDIQVGITSTGHGCAERDYPGIYTRVSAYTTWIQSKICALSANPPKTCSPTTKKPVTHPTKRPIIPPRPKPTILPRPKPTISPRPKPTIPPRPKPTILPRPKPTIPPRPKPTIPPRPKPSKDRRPVGPTQMHSQQGIPSASSP